MSVSITIVYIKISLVSLTLGYDLSQMVNSFIYFQGCVLAVVCILLASSQICSFCLCLGKATSPTQPVGKTRGT